MIFLIPKKKTANILSFLRRGRILFLLLCFNSQLSTLNSQTATSSLDKSKGFIGDYFTLKLAVNNPNVSSKIIFPTLTDSTIAPFVLVNVDSTTRTSSTERKFTITTFEEKNIQFPALPFLAVQNQDTIRFSSAPISVYIDTIAIDTTQDIKPIKAPLSVKISPAEMVSYFLWILGIVLLLALLYWLYRKYIVKENTENNANIYEPPYVIAHRKLKALEDEKLWQRGEVKQHYVRLSDIIREYLEKRYFVPAMEQTTDEIVFNLLKPVKINNGIKKKIERVLTVSDLAKFAKGEPLHNENTECMQLSFAIVDETKEGFSLEGNEENATRKKLYAVNVYKLLPTAKQPIIRNIVVFSLIVLLVIPSLFVALSLLSDNVYVLGILSEYAIELYAALFFFVGFIGLVWYFIRVNRLKNYVFEFSKNALIEKRRGKSDFTILLDQVKNISETKKGWIIIQGANAKTKLYISPFIEKRDEVKERLSDILPIQYV